MNKEFSTFADGSDCKECVAAERKIKHLTARLAAAEAAFREILDRAEDDDVVSCIAIASKAIGLRMFVGNPPSTEDEAAKGGRE